MASGSNAGSVIYLTGFEEPAVPGTRAVIDQRDKAFLPRVLAVTTGQTVVFRNRDPLFHNVWSVSKVQPFDLGTFREPDEKSITFSRAGLVRIFCNIHPQMIGSILVLKNNKYAVTGPKGDYRITGIPPGTHELRVWAEGTEPVVKPVVITASSDLRLDFTVRHNPLALNPTNKLGKPYGTY